MFSASIEIVLTIAYREAVARRHAYLTLEHLLYALAHDPEGESIRKACGTDVVLFARPSHAAPNAPQELVLAELTNGQLANARVLSRARAYYDVSIAALNRGALLSFVADQRTWARTLRCESR